MPSEWERERVHGENHGLTLVPPRCAAGAGLLEQLNLKEPKPISDELPRMMSPRKPDAPPRP